ncbi:MAG: DUF2793 domain-containing protein [Litorimonas sp.]
MIAYSSLHLDLPYILPAQAQKYITHNESLTILDVLVQLQVQSDQLLQPPALVDEGGLYLVASLSTSEWQDKANQIAHYLNGGWTFYPPSEGWRVWIQESGELKVWSGDAWRTLFGPTAVHDRFGINATADAQNRFTLSSSASLFNHEGGGHRLTINKKEMGDQSSILFQTGFSGRNEILSDENDDLVFKVSSDGAQFLDAMKIDGSSAETTIDRLKFPDFWRWYSTTTITVSPPNGQNEICVFDAASHNPGSAYNFQTGEFTVPKTGLYLLNVNFNTEGNSPLKCSVLVNGLSVSLIQFFPNNFSHMNKTICLPLNKNDILVLSAIGGGTIRFDARGDRDDVTLLRLGVL